MQLPSDGSNLQPDAIAPAWPWLSFVIQPVEFPAGLTARPSGRQALSAASPIARTFVRRSWRGMTAFRTVGIDTELINAIPAELVEDILRPDEAGEFDPHTRPDSADRLTLYFCLKEAAYKAFYPTCRRIIGFQDMRVRVDPEARRFLAEIPGLSGSGIPIFQGRYLVRHGRVYAASW